MNADLLKLMIYYHFVESYNNSIIFWRYDLPRQWHFIALYCHLRFVFGVTLCLRRHPIETLLNEQE